MTLVTRSRYRLFGVFMLLAVAIAALGVQARPAGADGNELIIVSMGDSFAAGQGAPNTPTPVPGVPAAGWDDAGCYRSRNAGVAQAFYQNVRPSYPNASILHVACNGATIQSGLLGTQMVNNQVVPSQISQVKGWMAQKPTKRIDALFISIGGNDMGFADIVQQCLKDNPFGQPTHYLTPLISTRWNSIWNDCQNNSAMINEINTRLAALDAAYDNLAATIKSQLPVDRVFITEYPQVTKGVGDVFGNPYCNLWPQGELVQNLSLTESLWAYNTLLPQLNGKVSAAAFRNANRGWHFVGGIAAAFDQHGFCAAPAGTPWINTDGVSWVYQGDRNGTMHPNAAGYNAIRAAVMSALNTHVLPPRLLPPVAPTNLRATAVTASSIAVAWNDNSAVEANHEMRIVAGGNTTVIYPPANATSYTHGVAAGQTYQFTLRACNSAGCSAWTPTLTVTAGVPPAAPSNLTSALAGTVANRYQVLRWTDNATSEDYFGLYYRVAGTSAWSSKALPSNTTQIRTDDGTFTPSATYEVRINACNSLGCSAFSNTLTFTVYERPEPPF